MPDNIYQKMLEAYQMLEKIISNISQTRFIRHENGDLEINGFKSPKTMKLLTLRTMDAFLDTLDELSFFFAGDEMVGIRNASYRKVKKIQISIPLEFKEEHVPYIETYKAFRGTQQKLKRHFLKKLDEQNNNNIKSSKFIWLGSQRQLVELFDVLTKQKWIGKEQGDPLYSHLPITEMFDIINSEGKRTAIDEEAFRAAWKVKNSVGVRIQSEGYEKVFDVIPERKVPKNKRNF